MFGVQQTHRQDEHWSGMASQSIPVPIGPGFEQRISLCFALIVLRILERMANGVNWIFVSGIDNIYDTPSFRTSIYTMRWDWQGRLPKVKIRMMNIGTGAKKSRLEYKWGQKKKKKAVGKLEVRLT